MSEAWSDEMKLRLLSAIWTKNHNQYAKAAGMAGLVINDPLAGMEEAYVAATMNRAKEIEKTTGHDLVAMLAAIKELLPEDGHYLLHTGLTSSDVLDQTTLLQTIWSTAYLVNELKAKVFELVMAAKAGRYDVLIMGRTHLQPAEPTTLLHRITLFSREIVDWMYMAETMFHRLIPYMGLMSGSVGTYANIVYTMQGLDVERFDIFDLRAKTQTLPRYLELFVAGTIDLLAAALHKVAFDFRLEASYGNITEADAEKRVGSSAMPYKKNPIRAEKINSLCRHAHHLVGNAWDNAAWQGLDRTLDDSANRRMWIPEAFLTMAEAVWETGLLIDDLSRIKETDPMSWQEVWTKSRLKSWTEARQAVNLPTDFPPPFETDRLERSIQHDKLLMDAYVNLKWPCGSLQYLCLTSPFTLLNEFRWDDR
jgi:adenylosuccinate lyase